MARLYEGVAPEMSAEAPNEVSSGIPWWTGISGAAQRIKATTESDRDLMKLPGVTGMIRQEAITILAILDGKLDSDNG